MVLWQSGLFQKMDQQSVADLKLNSTQNTEHSLIEEFKNGFDKIRCVTEDHTTPFNTIQNFLFCSFKRQENYVDKDMQK